jgi:dihydroorotate dehydrogenase
MGSIFTGSFALKRTSQTGQLLFYSVLGTKSFNTPTPKHTVSRSLWAKNINACKTFRSSGCCINLTQILVELQPMVVHFTSDLQWTKLTDIAQVFASENGRGGGKAVRSGNSFYAGMKTVKLTLERRSEGHKRHTVLEKYRNVNTGTYLHINTVCSTLMVNTTCIQFLFFLFHPAVRMYS